VGNKANKPWIWLARDAETREVVGAHVGGRDEAGAGALWANLPEAYRARATCYTDFWSAYATVIPPDQHEAVGKESGMTNHITTA